MGEKMIILSNMQGKHDGETGPVRKKRRLGPMQFERSARLGVTVLFVVAMLLTWLFLSQPHGDKNIIIDGQPLAISRAETAEERAEGLSGRASMARDHGLLLVFDDSSNTCLWMKDMRFNIDMVWLDESRRVITIKENVAPETYPESFCPSGPAAYALELNAEVVKQAGLRVGDRLTLR